MSAFLLVIAACGLAVLGVLFTIGLAVWVPAAFLQRAAKHGRFADLGAQDRHAPPARLIPVARPLAGSGLRIA